MTAHRLLLCVVLVVVAGACHAPPIPEAQRYPAGTPFRAQYRTIDGTRLRMIDTGAGTPVVLIHGFGASMYGWRYQLPPLVAAGPDGPTRVAATYVGLARGEAKTLVVQFTLPPGMRSVTVEPSARVPGERWQAGGEQWVDAGAHVVQW